VVLGATILPAVLIDVALGVTAFVVGFFAALAYSRFSRSGAEADSTPKPQETPDDSAANDAERANMAAQQLRDLAQNVASDVGAHNTLVGNISDQLDALKEGDDNNGMVVRGAVTKMLEANKKLQVRLEDAERKIQAQAEEIRAQQSEARTDALTRLANRRAFDSCLEENVKRFTDAGRPFSLLIFDVDHFKQFNDVHGHQAGDEVLRSVGRTLGRTVKAGDLACRYGGEEFAIVLANTRAGEAQVAAERVRRAIESMSVHFAGKSLRVTASIGMAEFQVGEDGAMLVRRADDSVYASKKAGRNCSHWHDGDDCVLIQPAGKTPAAAAKSEASASRPVSAPTGLGKLAAVPDRAAFVDELRRRIAASQRSGEPLSVLQFRVRDYGRLENSYGSAVGALLLDSLATFIGSTLRDMDLLGKLEPGEFIVMLPGSSASAAKIVGQRVRSSVSLCPIAMGVQQIRLDLDMGVAFVESGDDADDAIARAEKQLEMAAAEESAGRQASASGEAAAELSVAGV
jgi:diguanylate cyclase